ncbi:MAG: pilin [Patescibacteria group bacterium]|nr:pilin [Patescibacteria group bacterium]
MKKILFLIFVLAFFFLGLKPALAGNYLTVIPPRADEFYAVGNQVPVKIKISNTPADAKKINLYIHDTPNFADPLGNKHLKASYAPPPTNQETTFTYTWDTAAAGSNAGIHYFTAELLDANENKLDADTNSYTLLGPVNNPNNVDNNSGNNNNTNSNSTNNNGTTGTTTTTAGKAFDLGKLGTVQFLPTKVNSASDLIVLVINWLLGLAGTLAVVAIIYSGIMYMMAGSDEAKAEAAKKNLIWAITGVVVILLAFVIITWIGSLIKTGSA